MISIVILAAGSSSRMGRPKQNLAVNGKTLLQQAITDAQNITEHVVVILGANIDAVEPTVSELGVTILYNAEWNEGMASSIRKPSFIFVKIKR